MEIFHKAKTVALLAALTCGVSAAVASCGKGEAAKATAPTQSRPAATKQIRKAARPATPPDTLSAIERSMVKQGLVDVAKACPGVKVSLMYGRPDNFTGAVLYTSLRHAYLHPRAAAALKRAQQYLKRERPELSLIVFDATRPMRVQQKMWEKVEGTPLDIYVSNPAHGGGLHNYGLAVDISICDARGDTITMGTKVDYMGAAAHTDREAQLVKSGRLTSEAVRNRRLLRRVMKAAGFRQLPTEWWHYNLVSRATARRYYKVIK